MDLHHDPHHGVTSPFECGKLLVMRGVVIALHADVDEEAVVTVQRNIAQRFALDRNQALALLAGGFRDQLLGPGAEIGDLLRRQNGHLVAAFEAGQSHRKAKLHAGIFMRRHVRAARAHHVQGIVDQLAHIDAGRGGRHQTKRREHRIAPADGRLAMEDAGKTLFDRDLLQR